MGNNNMGDDSIDTIISHIDMGYLVTLVRNNATAFTSSCARPSSDYTCRP